MDDLNIYTLLMIIRGLSNEVTVRALAADLGISYSTLARCKNGRWPRSVTLDAMRIVIDNCRTRFFSGDGDALADSVTLQLHAQGIATTELEDARERGGYDAFLSELLTQASGRATDTDSPPETGGQADNAAGGAPSASPATHGDQLLQRLLPALPIVVILLIGLFNLSLSSLFVWAATHRMAFLALSLLIAVSPTLVGLAVDAPIAWHAFHRARPKVACTPAAFVRVAKYGDVEGVTTGAGRIHLEPRHLAYQSLCNVTGAMVYVSLLTFLLTLPGFQTFFTSHTWDEFLKMGVAVAFVIAYRVMRDQPRRLGGGSIDDGTYENPDAYLPTRAHVWANNIHLVWTNSLITVLLLSMVAYGIMRLRTLPAPTLILWPYLQAMAFFAYSSISPYAARIRATGVGTFLPGVCVTSVGVVAYVSICYLPTQGMAAICATCALCATGAVAWMRSHAHGTDHDWIAQGRGTGAYVLAGTASLVFLLIVGMMTSAFV